MNIGPMDLRNFMGFNCVFILNRVSFKTDSQYFYML